MDRHLAIDPDELLRGGGPRWELNVVDGETLVQLAQLVVVAVHEHLAGGARQVKIDG